MINTDTVTLLRIGKTGTTALRIPLKKHNGNEPKIRVKVVGHNVLLRNLFAEESGKVAITIREPLSRFVSAFNSRLRMGRPRYDNPWNNAEAKAFGFFDAPNKLAEALYSEDDKTRRRARRAMQAISMVKKGYAHFLESVELLEAVKHRIVFIGAQEHLASDFERLKELIGADPSLSLPADDVISHKTPGGFDKALSDTGRANLIRFLAEDYKIYAWCVRRREELLKPD
jgi:hypothetical protein